MMVSKFSRLMDVYRQDMPVFGEKLNSKVSTYSLGNKKRIVNYDFYKK